ncbi:hypothetical protein ACQKEU_29285, partial [Acidovorax sp. NPDC077664]|uniref:hypothetical protein n=1 Tax=Acidovorax sp. NPDC077664 TaxID=3390544 RepID=UPI003D01B6F8
SELWAVAITLRIVLVENLRRLADQITAGRADRALGRQQLRADDHPRQRKLQVRGDADAHLATGPGPACLCVRMCMA